MAGNNSSSRKYNKIWTSSLKLCHYIPRYIMHHICENQNSSSLTFLTIRQNMILNRVLTKVLKGLKSIFPLLRGLKSLNFGLRRS